LPSELIASWPIQTNDPVNGYHMKICLILALLPLLAILPEALAEKKAAQAPNSAVTVPDSRNQIIRLTDRGVEPAALKMKREDSIVFFVNDTAGSLATLEIDFGKRAMHCGGGNLRAMDDGKIRSVRPFGPNDFASSCFHDTGRYAFTVYGLKANPKGIRSTIDVE